MDANERARQFLRDTPVQVSTPARLDDGWQCTLRTVHPGDPTIRVTVKGIAATPEQAEQDVYLRLREKTVAFFANPRGLDTLNAYREELAYEPSNQAITRVMASLRHRHAHAESPARIFAAFHEVLARQESHAPVTIGQVVAHLVDDQTRQLSLVS